MGAETAQKSDHPAESVVLSSRCRESHSYGHQDGRHCRAGGFDDGLGRGHCYARDHVFVRHLGPCRRDYGRRVLVVHGRHCILRPCYAFGGGLRSGHAAGRQVETEDEYQRREKSVNLWAREPYVKDEQKPLVVADGLIHSKPTQGGEILVWSCLLILSYNCKVIQLLRSRGYN
jgi:hypothetical protein